MAIEPFNLMPLHEAVQTLGLDHHFQGRATLSQFESKNFVRHFPNDTFIEGDLDMDSLLWSESLAGMVFDGDLELNGSIFNWEIDTPAAFMAIRGNLKCRNIVFGSMDLVVRGNVTAANLIVATYNHGYLLIHGEVRAKYVIIDDDGDSVIEGSVRADGWNASRNARVDLRRSEWINEVRPEFRSEFFEENGDFRCPNGNVDLVKALLAERHILREH